MSIINTTHERQEVELAKAIAEDGMKGMSV